MTVNNNITEEFQYDVSYTAGGTNFDLTDVAYDVSFNSVPFVLKIDNQNPYLRETAPYKKEQFDNSKEPGEQSLTGWWVRSQTSWHSGAGIEFYEPGTDFEYTSNRFHDSRGVDIWTTGELRLHLDVFHAYTGTQGINAATGNDGTNDVLVSGDANGILKRIRLNGNNDVTSNATYVQNYTAGATYPDGHTGTNHPFYSVASDGSTYYAVCDSVVHKGTIGTLTSDDIYFRYTSGTSTNAFVKYAKGFMLFGHDNKIAVIKTTEAATASGTHTSGTVHTPGTSDTYLSNFTTHINTSWQWNDATASPGPVYMSGNGGSNGEIWRVNFDDTTNSLDMPGATMSLSLPDGELVKAIHFYLGYLVVGTNQGIRICQVNSNGDLVMGPLLIETSYAVNGFTERGSYIYAATKAADSTGNINGILIRIDLSQQFSDGTFAYAYDLEYQSTPDSSDCTEVYNLDNRLVMVIQENGASGELQVEHTTNYRSSGYLQTGKIRYGTVEPKFFKYLQTRGLVATGDSIAVQTIDYAGNEYEIITLDAVSLGQNVGLSQPIGGQEFIAIKYTLNNGSPVTDYPVLQSYQLKSIPGVPRQRIYQYPLSCYDIEMDKYNVQFGYKDRAYDVIQTLEDLEVTGDFVTIKDYRTEESFQGVIEEVRFTNESSPDKDSNGLGGLLLVTVRKL
jgi:hypothetical protein